MGGFKKVPIRPEDGTGKPPPNGKGFVSWEHECAEFHGSLLIRFSFFFVHIWEFYSNRFATLNCTGCQTDDHGSSLCFGICKRDTTEYF